MYLKRVSYHLFIYIIFVEDFPQIDFYWYHKTLIWVCDCVTSDIHRDDSIVSVYWISSGLLRTLEKIYLLK